MADEKAKPMEGYVGRIEDEKKVSEMTPAQHSKWELLKGRMVKPTGKQENPEGGFNCCICQGRGKKAQVVLNEKGEKRLVGANCLRIYFGVTPAGGRSGGAGRRLTL